MPELSLNVLDVTENSTRAGAKLVSIRVTADHGSDTLTIQIEDDGCGMTKEQVEQVTDPFFTTRTTRKVGLGIPFYKYAAESTGGSFSIASEVGKGTTVTAVFTLSHIDRMPLGDISSTIHITESTHFLFINYPLYIICSISSASFHRFMTSAFYHLHFMGNVI